MSGNCDDPTKRSGKAGVRTNPAKNKPVTATSIHGRNTFGQNIPHDSDNSSDFDVWVAPDISGRYNLSFYNTCMVF
jgi:hypothetical protein